VAKLLYSFDVSSGERIEEHQFLTWTRGEFFPTETVTLNTEQQVGCGVDGWIGHYAVEVKDDLASAKTGNLFIETGQRFAGGDWMESGLTLAAKQADIYLHCAYTRTKGVVFCFDPQKLFDYVRTISRRVETQTGANGNRPGSYARGRLLPFLGEDGVFLSQFVLDIPA